MPIAGPKKAAKAISPTDLKIEPKRAFSFCVCAYISLDFHVAETTALQRGRRDLATVDDRPLYAASPQPEVGEHAIVQAVERIDIPPDLASLADRHEKPAKFGHGGRESVHAPRATAAGASIEFGR